MKNKALALTTALALSLIAVACGGGGGSSSSSSSTTTSQTTNYLSSVAVGDFGKLEFNRETGAFKFTYLFSGYGLENQVINANCALDTNAAYVCTKTGDSKKFPLVIRDNYAIFSVQMDPTKSPNDWTPVFGIIENQSISSASRILEFGNTLKVSGYSCNVDANKVPTACWATSSIGIMEAGSDDSTLKITLCNNGSQQEDNYNLNKCYENRNNPSAISKGDQPYGHPGTIYQVTATFNPATKTWDTTPNDKSKTSRGVFAVDAPTNSLVGFFDDVAAVQRASNGFSFVTTNFSRTDSLTSDVYLNIIPKQSVASGGSGGHGFQQHFMKADGTTYDQCAAGTPQIPNNMNDYLNQVDKLGTMPIPGYVLSNDKAPSATSDYYVLSTYIKASDGTAFGIAAANNSKYVNGYTKDKPQSNFKLLYYATKAGTCYGSSDE